MFVGMNGGWMGLAIGLVGLWSCKSSTVWYVWVAGLWVVHWLVFML